MGEPAWVAAPCLDRHWPSGCQGPGKLYKGQAASVVGDRPRLTDGILRDSCPDSNPRKNIGIRVLLVCASGEIAAEIYTLVM